jgi:hypothetical protein
MDMRKRTFSKEQTIGLLKQAEADKPVAGIGRKAGAGGETLRLMPRLPPAQSRAIRYSATAW